MNWFKFSSTEGFVKKVKDILKTNSFTSSMADYYNIPLSDIDTKMEIEICDLNGKFAEGNGTLIRIDKKLLDNNFFDENFHFVIHEFFHWLKRRSESKFYFNDPEEVQSFVLQMAWQLMNGKGREEVIKKLYPIIGSHFKDKNKFNQIFKEMLSKAESLSSIYSKERKF